MATVTGLTAARMEAIEAASVVSGTINGSGHLILSKHDGSTIDAGYMIASVPDASDVVKGIVELATAAETTATTDAIRAVTPASLAGTIVKTLTTNSIAEADLITSYPTGISTMSVGSGSGWSINSGFGEVVTHYHSDTRAFQFFHYHTANTTWKRYWYQGVWGSWTRFATTTYLAAMDTTQQLIWGTDTNLYRASADVLKTDDQFQAGGVITGLNGMAMPNTKQFLVGTTPTTATYAVQRDANTDYVFGSQVGSEANRRYLQQADGSKYWGDGTNAVDVKMYRSGADRLALDDRFDERPMQAIFRRVSGTTAASGSDITATYDTTTADYWAIGNSSGVFTIPTGWGGLWEFVANLAWSAPASSTVPAGIRVLQIRKNASVVVEDLRSAPIFTANQPFSLCLTVNDVMTAGDTVWINHFHNQGAAAVTYTCRFTIRYKGRST